MWKRFLSTVVEVQYPIQETIPLFKTPISLLSFRREELKTLDWLFAVAPCFPVKSENVSIILEPKEFYDTLVNKCENAQKRITFASLYLGTGLLEQNLLKVVDSTLQRSVIVNILLDYQRGTRGNISSKSLLLPLVQKYEKRCKISLYHTPYLRGLYKKLVPQRWNELIGLQHMKVYLIDDTVIISGANLSNDYFTNRQDRYVVVEDTNLANFYSDLIQNVQEFSLQLNKEDKVVNLESSLSPYSGDKNEFIARAHDKVLNFFQSTVKDQQEKSDQNLSQAETWIFPLIEMGQLGIHHDSVVTERVISGAAPGTLIKMATGYFNLTKKYMDTIVYNSKAMCTLLMAHPNANGFQGARGPAGGIPAAYSLLAKKFYDQLVASGEDDRVTLLEYEKKSWTFHAKGLWYYTPGADLPSMSLIGSSNFGERSVNRDLETQMAVVTVNKRLRRKLHDECERLHSDSTKSKDSLYDREVPKWVKLVVGVFRNYF